MYPSNKLEDLSLLLSEVLKSRPKKVLDPSIILVPNPGMQHWLSLKLAQQLGVSMNVSSPLPSRYIWDLSRQILGEGKVPKQSPYRREVLSWRIFALLNNNTLIENHYFKTIKKYWASDDPDTKEKRQFWFAQQLADVFEQYLVFRPDWLLAWEANELFQTETESTNKMQLWQAWIWRELVKEQKFHPANLQSMAINSLLHEDISLPKDIYVFALNSMSSLHLKFFDAIAKHTHVHFFQLNPSVNYWGDALSDRALAYKHRHDAFEKSLFEEQVHPLLRNLGGQGRDLNNLLVDMTHQEIASFDIEPTSGRDGRTLLSCIQGQILDGEITQPPLSSEITESPYYPSIAVHACHSEVRELQVLKDTLLARFDADKSLQPRDVLVMCPSIEKYSPYINAIFTQSQNQSLNIPVSISDRKPIESEMLIVAVLGILKMGNSRFDASTIVDLVSLPSIASRFGLAEHDLDFCATYLKRACIIWGLDDEHVSSALEVKLRNNQHTWEKGLKRIIVGWINAPTDILVDDVATLGFVEGQATKTLGRFMQAIEQIHLLVAGLSENRTPRQWSEYVALLLENFFAPQQEDSFAVKLLQKTLNDIIENTESCQFDTPVSLFVFVESLEALLSIPETRSQFYAGKVSFCSMLPMRSIPFKVIAILGLNQSEFPRQDLPAEFNLMNYFPSIKGDRSRRGDDRYLFLESIVSARQYLHLSYQYKKINDNSDRQASSVLALLIEHCHEYFGEEALPIVKHSLHPFSIESFAEDRAYLGCYEEGWRTQASHLVKLAITQHAERSGYIDGKIAPDQIKDINLQDLYQCLNNSLAFYVNRHLNLYLSKPEARDFAENYQLNGLSEYMLKKSFSELWRNTKHKEDLSNAKRRENIAFNQQIAAVRQSGELPYYLDIDSSLIDYAEEVFSCHNCILHEGETQSCSGQLDLNGFSLSYHFDFIKGAGSRAVKYTNGKPKIKHMLISWLQYLLLLMHDETEKYAHENLSMRVYFTQKIDKPKANEKYAVKYYECRLSDKKDAHKCLSNILLVYAKAYASPLILDHGLAEQILDFESPEDALASPVLKLLWKEASQAGNDHSNKSSHLPNPYFDHLFKQMPEIDIECLQAYFDCFYDMQQGEIFDAVVPPHLTLVAQAIANP
ncbi:exodeoxyribonuclease V subunit gamma [Glaciecola petra]|uniref:RecBCD enzyme subunit RecC n=1 Tax=Glaciecola petra TaxID=3075602 RepID=A0ABU2ZPU4_9ALTE|nr:exodeoxyribonuclease V subunit gamma [Aestuariibacter sp. P117]MDT0594068.1 exodeoxyribonuclease V subunit gamma [Aestuariibacter sp. P117]